MPRLILAEAPQTDPATRTLQADRATWQALEQRLHGEGQASLVAALAQRTGPEAAQRVTLSLDQARAVQAVARQAAPVAERPVTRRIIIDAGDR